MAPPRQLALYPHAGNRLPPNAQVHAVTTSDGCQIRAMTAGNLEPNGASRGTVVVLNGRTEFLERYFETATDLVKRGFCYASFDWRGQGGSQRALSDPLRGHVSSFRKYDEDLRAVMTDLVVQKCPAPYYALAHSTGGNILLRSLRQPTLFTKAIATSPLIDFIYKPWPRPVAKALAWLAVLSGMGWLYLPGLKRGPLASNAFDGNALTSDRARWQRDVATLDKFPQLLIGGPTFSWFRAGFASNAALARWPRSKLIACPLLILAPSKESVVDPHAAREFSKRVPGTSYVQITGALHEILMEQDQYRNQFWAAFDSFVGM